MASPAGVRSLGAAYVKDEAGALRETPDEDAGACGGSARCLSPRSGGRAPLVILCQGMRLARVPGLI